jgi:hypothetical protein
MSEAISAFAEMLRGEARFTARDREARELWSMVQPSHQDLHNHWVDVSFTQNPKRFMAVPRARTKNPPLRDIQNEAQPGDLDQRGGDIDGQQVQAFLAIEPSLVVGEIQPLSAVSTPVPLNSWSPALPGSMWQDSGTVVGLKCEQIQMPAGVGRRGIGQILLYDSVKFEAVSEPVSIMLEEGRVRFPLDQPEVFFRVAAPDAAVGFICIICRIDGELRIPSAVGFQPIFTPQPDRRPPLPIPGITSFQPIWANASQALMSEMITTINTKASGTYKIDSKITITVYDKPNIHPWFYSWMQPAGEAKLLALPINSGLHFPTPVGFISDIRIGLGKQIKSPTLQLLVQVIPDVPSNWAAQFDELAVMITDVGRLEGRYTSCAITVNEEMEFSDLIRIVADECSTRESSLVVFYLRIRAEKKENPIFKIGIIPLDLDSIPETGPVRVSLYDQKSLPKDFLKQAAKPIRKHLCCAGSPSHPYIGCSTSSVAQANLTITINFDILRSFSSSDILTIYLHAFAQSLHLLEKNCVEGLPRDFRQNDPNTSKKFRWSFSAISYQFPLT